MCAQVAHDIDLGVVVRDALHVRFMTPDDTTALFCRRIDGSCSS